MRSDIISNLFPRLLKLATAWDAVLLIDEADVWSSLTDRLKAYTNLNRCPGLYGEEKSTRGTSLVFYYLIIS